MLLRIFLVERSVRPAARPAPASRGQRFAASIRSANISIPALLPAPIRLNRHSKHRSSLRKDVPRDGVPLPVPRRQLVPGPLLLALSRSSIGIFKVKTKHFTPMRALSTARRTTSGLLSRPRVSKFLSRVIGSRICRKWNGKCRSALTPARNGQTKKSGKSSATTKSTVQLHRCMKRSGLNIPSGDGYLCITSFWRLLADDFAKQQ